MLQSQELSAPVPSRMWQTTRIKWRIMRHGRTTLCCVPPLTHNSLLSSIQRFPFRLVLGPVQPCRPKSFRMSSACYVGGGWKCASGRHSASRLLEAMAKTFPKNLHPPVPPASRETATTGSAYCLCFTGHSGIVWAWK